ncbi:EamA family transporter [Bdellovibrio sp. HCB2-146]|uniref:EamA family transporter n=1 Tax=Bdellovibrio sp. HCB2-146 TaxID=3394362 RepID=UPI0039BCA4AC
MHSMSLSLLYLFFAMVSIQSGASLAKQLFPVAGPAGTTGLRVGFAALVLLAIWRPWRVRFSKTQILDILFYGISLGLMNILFYLSLAKIPLGIAVGVEFTGPLVLALLSSKKWIDLVWAVIAGLGIYMILPHNQGSEALDLVGILLALGAGFFWALYIVFGQRASRGGHSSGHVTAVGMTIAALSVLPFAVILNGEALINVSLWPMGLLIGVLSSALPYSFEMMALKNIPTKTFGVLMSFEPAMAALAGFLFLHESLSLPQLFAIACIMVASAGATATARA